MLALILATALSIPAGTDLLQLADCPPGTALPPGWAVRPVPGVPAPDFQVGQRGGVRVLRVDGQGAAAWAYNELATPLDEESGRLRWSWRALELPAGADLDRQAGDDAPLRIYVVFGKPTLFARPRAIFYSWQASETPGSERTAFASDRVAVVPMAGGRTADGRWRAEAVQPFRDFRRLWGEDPPPIRVVGVMQDTDDTGSAAAAELRSLIWEVAPAAG